MIWCGWIVAQVAKRRVAAFVRACEADIVHCTNATTAANIVLNSTQLRQGDLLLITSITYAAVSGWAKSLIFVFHELTHGHLEILLMFLQLPPEHARVKPCQWCPTDLGCLISRKIYISIISQSGLLWSSSKCSACIGKFDQSGQMYASAHPILAMQPTDFAAWGMIAYKRVFSLMYNDAELGWGIARSLACAVILVDMLCLIAPIVGHSVSPWTPAELVKHV